MSNTDPLDARLLEILKNWHQTGCPFSKEYGKCINADCSNKKENLIARIKQAFEQEGWVDASRLLVITHLLSEQGELLKNMSEEHVNVIRNLVQVRATGQEFYERSKAGVNGAGVKDSDMPEILNRGSERPPAPSTGER